MSCPIRFPRSTPEAAELIRDATKVFIFGEESNERFAAPAPILTPEDEWFSRLALMKAAAERAGECESTALIKTTALDSILDVVAEDQIVVVQAGVSVCELQFQLQKHGQALPILGLKRDADRDMARLQGCAGTLGGAVSANMPHLLAGAWGSWRDWVLGMTVVLADGTIAKTGSRAVKNVAGYDIHKLFTGARGTLGMITEVILRTYPVKSLPDLEPPRPALARNLKWIQRTLAADFQQALDHGGSSVICHDRESGTLWYGESLGEVQRFPAGWVMQIDTPQQFADPHAKLMRRAKEVFDPTAKFNSGVMGIY